MSGAPAASPFKQPKAVFAVAFACVVSFMGIGLVDPILPAISHELNASPSEVTLLFTSYLVVTAVAMLITNCPPGNPPGDVLAGEALLGQAVARGEFDQPVHRGGSGSSSA
jgi:MFS family permease